MLEVMCVLTFCTTAIKRILIYVFALLALASTGQESAKDSLKRIIVTNSEHDSVRVKACLELASRLYLFNADSALVLCKTASELSVRAKYLQGECDSYGWLGFLFNQTGDIESALHNYEKSLNLNRQLRDTMGIATILNNMGAILEYQGSIPESIDYYNESLKLRESIDDVEGVATVLNNLGTLFLDQEDRKAAMDYYQRSYELSKSIDDPLGRANSLNNIGGMLDDEGKYTEALSKYNKALEILQSIQHKWAIAITLNNIGFIHDHAGSKDTALYFYQESVRIQEEIGDKAGMANTLCNIGYIEFERGQYERAYDASSQGLALARSVGSPSLISKNCRLLSLLSQKNGRYEDALAYYTEHIEMRDSIRNQETEKASIRQQLRYEYDKKEALKKIEHQKELAVSAEKKKKQEIVSVAAGSGLFMVLLFAVFVISRLRLSRKQNVVIREQKSKVESQHQEITDSINYARRLQEAILPPLQLISNYLPQCFCLYKPKDIVAGDFYFFDVLEENNSKQIFLAVADCTGHGVRGAMVSIVGANGLKRCIREFKLRNPGDILNKLSSIVTENFSQNGSVIHDGMDIALCRIEIKDGEPPVIHYAGAYNPLWVINAGRVSIPDQAVAFKDLPGIEIKPTRQSIGYVEERLEYKTNTLVAEPGDMFYLFTDGFVDQFGGEQHKKYKSANFKSLLASIHKKEVSVQRELLDDTFENWKGENEQLDDVCVMGIRL